MQSSPEAFFYLKYHVGTYTRCENFMIKFYAGLAAREVELLERIPHDIARDMQSRRLYIMSGGSDRVFRGEKYFKLSASHKSRCCTTLHVVKPSAVTKTVVAMRTQAEWQQYLSRTPRYHGHQYRKRSRPHQRQYQWRLSTGMSTDHVPYFE